MVNLGWMTSTLRNPQEVANEVLKFKDAKKQLIRSSKELKALLKAKKDEPKLPKGEDPKAYAAEMGVADEAHGDPDPDDPDGRLAEFLDGID